MITQYGSKLVIAFLALQHALRVRLAGTKSFHAANGGSSVAVRVQRLGALVGNARVLYRIWGLLPMLQWVSEAGTTRGGGQQRRSLSEVRSGAGHRGRLCLPTPVLTAPRR